MFDEINKYLNNNYFKVIIIILLILNSLIFKKYEKSNMNFIKDINNENINLSIKKIISILIGRGIMCYSIYFFSIKNNSILNASILVFLISSIIATNNIILIDKYPINMAIQSIINNILYYTLIASLILV